MRTWSNFWSTILQTRGTTPTFFYATPPSFVLVHMSTQHNLSDLLSSLIESGASTRVRNSICTLLLQDPMKGIAKSVWCDVYVEASYIRTFHPLTESTLTLINITHDRPHRLSPIRVILNRIETLRLTNKGSKRIEKVRSEFQSFLSVCTLAQPSVRPLHPTKLDCSSVSIHAQSCNGNKIKNLLASIIHFPLVNHSPMQWTNSQWLFA